jgi:hypothetical protein
LSSSALSLSNWMMPPRSFIGRNSALKSVPDIVATFFACTGWQPRAASPPTSPHDISTRRRIFLSSGLQYSTSEDAANRGLILRRSWWPVIRRAASRRSRSILRSRPPGWRAGSPRRTIAERSSWRVSGCGRGPWGARQAWGSGRLGLGRLGLGRLGLGRTWARQACPRRPDGDPESSPARRACYRSVSCRPASCPSASCLRRFLSAAFLSSGLSSGFLSAGFLSSGLSSDFLSVGFLSSGLLVGWLLVFGLLVGLVLGLRHGLGGLRCRGLGTDRRERAGSMALEHLVQRELEAEVDVLVAQLDAIDEDLRRQHAEVVRDRPPQRLVEPALRVGRADAGGELGEPLARHPRRGFGIRLRRVPGSSPGSRTPTRSPPARCSDPSPPRTARPR